MFDGVGLGGLGLGALLCVLGRMRWVRSTRGPGRLGHFLGCLLGCLLGGLAVCVLFGGRRASCPLVSTDMDMHWQARTYQRDAA